MAARESFKTALRKYKKSFVLGSDNRTHLERWIDDDRTEEVWDTIQCAVRSNDRRLPPETFINNMLAAKRVAIATGHRGKLRESYRNAAGEMERVAKFLRRPHPFGMPGYPQSAKLTRMLDEAASYYRTIVEPRRNVPGVLKFSRQAQPHMIFISMVSNVEGNSGTMAR